MNKKGSVGSMQKRSGRGGGGGGQKDNMCNIMEF